MKLKHRIVSLLCAGTLLTGLLSGCGGPGTEFDGTNKSSGKRICYTDICSSRV